jgi:hypothetical protein
MEWILLDGLCRVLNWGCGIISEFAEWAKLSDGSEVSLD